MGFSPWAILAIALTGVGIAGILAIHFWRSRVDKRQQAAAAAAASADLEKSVPPADDYHQPHSPSDFGGSGYSSSPTLTSIPAAAMPGRPSGISSGDGWKNGSRGGSTVVGERPWRPTRNY